MSQIFDSLRRSRKSDTRSTPSRTSHGDAVLTTLGYAGPVRRKPSRAVLLGGLILAIAAAAWIGWRAYLDLNATPAPSARVLSPRVPKPAPPVTRPPTPEALPAATPERADPVPQTVGISNVGRRAARALPDPGTPAAPAVSAVSPPANDLELALYYHRTGDYTRALQHYRALLEQNELNAQAHNNLGLL